jgi:hypothetical protein
MKLAEFHYLVDTGSLLSQVAHESPIDSDLGSPAETHFAIHTCQHRKYRHHFDDLQYQDKDCVSFQVAFVRPATLI